MAYTFESLTGTSRKAWADTADEMRPVKKKDVQANGAMRYTNQMGNLLMGDVMERAANDKLKQYNDHQTKGYEDEDTYIERGMGTSEEEEADDDDTGYDNELDRIRTIRMKQLQDAVKKAEENKAKGHGEYEEIVEEEFLPTVTKSHRCIVHFYHKDFESCKVADMHLKKCAKKFLGTRFVKLNSEKAPFFVNKLSIQTLPTIGCFIDGVLIYKQLGFIGVSEGGKSPNEFPTFRLAKIFSAVQAIEEEVDSDTEFES